MLVHAGVPQLLPHSVPHITSPILRQVAAKTVAPHHHTQSSRASSRGEQRSCKGNPIRGAGAAASVRASEEDGEQRLILQTWMMAEAHQGSGFVLWAHRKLPQ